MVIRCSLRTAAAGRVFDLYHAPVCYQPGGVGNVYCPDDNTDGIGARLPISQFAGLTAKVYPLPDFALNYRRLPLGHIVYQEQLTPEWDATVDEQLSTFRHSYES